MPRFTSIDIGEWVKWDIILNGTIYMIEVNKYANDPAKKANKKWFVSSDNMAKIILMLSMIHFLYLSNFAVIYLMYKTQTVPP